MGVCRDELEPGTLTLDQYLDSRGEGSSVEWLAWLERRRVRVLFDELKRETQ